MKRDKPPYLRDYELKRWGELSLRYFAKQCAEEAETLERAAAIARDKASWFPSGRRSQGGGETRAKEQRPRSPTQRLNIINITGQNK
jgi:hypothetical protein